MSLRSPAIALALTLAALPAAAGDPARTISVRGRTEVTFPSDHVTIRTGVSVRADDAVTAQKQAREKAAAILAFVRQMGVAPEDLATDHLDLDEVTQRDDDDCPNGTTVTYHVATVGMRVRLRELARYDDLLAGIVNRGANRIAGIAFDSTERVAKAKQARVGAIQAARDKAIYLARELGLTLGPPVTIQEVAEKSVFDFRSLQSNSVDFYVSPEANEGSTSLSPSELVVAAEVDVVFELVLPR